MNVSSFFLLESKLFDMSAPKPEIRDCISFLIVSYVGEWVGGFIVKYRAKQNNDLHLQEM